MSKAKLYYKEIPMTPTLFSVEVIISKDYHKICEKIAGLTEYTVKEVDEYIEGNECFIYIQDEKMKHLFICVYSFDVGVIVHESIHAVWRLLDLVHIEITSENHEIQAYFTEHLVNEILKMKTDKECLY